MDRVTYEPTYDDRPVLMETDENSHGYKLVNRAGVNEEPTEAQKAAGNYSKRKTTFQGLPVSIENEKGSERSGVGPDGTPWRTAMPCQYGYFLRSEGMDGEHVDVYLGDNEDAPHVFVVNQIDPEDASYDEHKVIAAHQSKENALATYYAGFSDGSGPSRMGGCITMTVDQFKDWLKNGDTTKPAEEPVETIENSGTSEGAVAGWESRRIGGKEAKTMLKPSEKPGGNNPSNSIKDDDAFILSRTPLSEIAKNESGEGYDSTVNLERAKEYASRTGDFPPVVVGKLRDSGRNIHDGGHRVSAARMRGDKYILTLERVRKTS